MLHTLYWYHTAHGYPRVFLICCWWGLTLIPAWISNHMPSKVWDEATYTFPNFNGCTVNVWEWISNFILRFMMDLIIYPCWDLSYSMLLKGFPSVPYLGHYIWCFKLWCLPYLTWSNQDNVYIINIQIFMIANIMVAQSSMLEHSQLKCGCPLVCFLISRASIKKIDKI